MLTIAAIAIPVTNQAKSKEFYLRLGFDLLAEAPMEDGKKWVQMGLPGGQTTITLVTWFSQMPPGCLQGVVLLSDDIHGNHSSYKAQGLPVSAVSETPNGKFFTVRDPDGNGISIQQQTAD